MATSVQLEQTSAGYFGRVDSGSDRDTAGYSVCNSGWTSGTGGYTIRACLYLLCTCCTNFLLRMTFELKLIIKFQYVSVSGNSPKNLLEYLAISPNVKTLFGTEYRFIFNNSQTILE